MRTKVVFSILLGLLTIATATGQGTASVRVPGDGNFLAFASKGLPKAEPLNPTKIERSTGVVTLLPGDDRIYVWDVNSGNLAWRTAIPGKEFFPELKDYKEIAQVVVKVESAGKPVSAATVELTDSKRTRSELIAPGSEGLAKFFAVQPGKATVKVVTKGKEKTHEITQVFELALARPESSPELVISVPGDVLTEGGAANGTEPGTSEAAPSGEGSAAKGKADDKKSLEPSPLNRILSVLVGLGVVAAIVWFALQFAKKNPQKVSDTLEQLGAQIPKPSDADALSPTIVQDPPKPAPPTKIILDPSQADPGVVSSAYAPSNTSTDQISLGTPSPSIGSPSLVTDSGVAIPLSEGETLVGRDAGLGLSLTGETTVSRRHARLDLVGGQVTVTDLGSSNGTFVNGAKVDGTVTLRPGDQVQFGAARFRYQG